MKNSIDIYYAVVRAWVVHNLEGESEIRHNETMFYAAAKTYAVLDINPPHQRPYKDHHICMSWFYEHLRRLEDKAIFVCPLESGRSSEIWNIGYFKSIIFKRAHST